MPSLRYENLPVYTDPSFCEILVFFVKIIPYLVHFFAMSTVQAEKMKKAPPSQEYCRLLCMELIFLWHALPTCTVEELQPYLTGTPILLHLTVKSVSHNLQVNLYLATHR